MANLLAQFGSALGVTIRKSSHNVQEHVPILPCGTESNHGQNHGKTNEHIIPKWLIGHLGLVETPVDDRRFDIPSGRILHERQYGTRSFVSGRVCAECNSGWMSDLENEAKPLLIRLIADPHELATLTKDEQHTVARWTMKTAAVLNKASFGNLQNPLDRPIPKAHAESAKSAVLPEDVLIVGAGCRSDKISSFIQNASWASPKHTVPLRVQDRDRSYKVGMSFRSLLLAVAYYPNPEYLYGLTASRFITLWSGSRGIVMTQDGVGEVPIRANAPILEGFLGNIFVVSKAWWHIRQNVLTTTLVSIPSRKN